MNHPFPVISTRAQLVIDAQTLNGISTIYNVPGIPIADLGRSMQAEGMREWRHGGGFSLDASVTVDAYDRAGLERIKRSLRPGVSA